jgi:uncharacterized protein YbjT (DUF2867 family)
MRILITGVTGYVGGALVPRLQAAGHDLRGLARNPNGSLALDVVRGDVTTGTGLDEALEGVDVAYYLVHGMGRGSDDDFVDRERATASNFAGTMKDEGVDRVVYLGGLGENPSSKHLKSRAETGRILGEEGPDLTYFRAAMVVGAGSESYQTLRHLVKRLPVMITPSWLDTPTQPVASDDVIDFLAQAATLEDSRGREIQIGGPDILSYKDMLDRMAEALGRRPRPKLPVPVLSPTLSSQWIGLVTPVDAGVAKPLVEGLATETVVTDPEPMEMFDIEPIGIDEALRRAIDSEKQPA